ncbi:cytochrome P450 [Microbacterium sp. A8/3-1]|uniref:Cytochrome P450 n=1 Tax=Microbacterium sp. A8/3-1 TaxID=3160749 RepID=A0AAU7VXZ8_9MICO
MIDERLRLLDERQHVDLVADFFEPVSVLSVGRVIGVPELDAATLQHWFRGIILGSSNVTMDMDIAVEANAVSREIDEYMFDVFARVEKNPDDSIVSHLLQGAAGDTLVERVRDITPTLKVVIGGGLQEPGHGASTLAAALLADDGARADFNTDPAGLIKPAIEEAIRWVSPIQVNIRRTRIDTELEGVTLPAGTYVNAAVGAANRSVSVFGDDAAEFDLRRAVRPHLAFGTGMHFCAGNYFGRAAISRSIRGLFERFPEMRLDESDGPVRFRGFVFRSPAAVRVQLRG